MFDIGFWELVLIFALGLLVLGPEKLPKVAGQLGNWAGQARRMARILTTQLREEIEKESERQTSGKPPVNKPPAPAPETYSRPGLEELRTTPSRDGAETHASSAPPDSSKIT